VPGFSAGSVPMPSAAAMPWCTADRLACRAASGRFQLLRTAASSAAAGRPASAPARPSTSMLIQLPGSALAIFLSGSATALAPLRRNTSGTSPPSASPMSRLPACSGISSAKRWTFCQSTASSRSKRSSSDSTGVADSRNRAAASPPRICGPLVRTIRPYRPACAAASSSSVPAVMTPLPPLPAIAIESPASAGCDGGRSLRSRAWLSGNASTPVSCSHEVGCSKQSAGPPDLDVDQGSAQEPSPQCLKDVIRYRFTRLRQPYPFHSPRPAPRRTHLERPVP